VRRAVDTGRYTLADQISTGPAMYDTARLDRAGGLNATGADPITGLGLHGPPPLDCAPPGSTRCSAHAAETNRGPMRRRPDIGDRRGVAC
jgi:hypothetical protein